eukprot:531736-Alexandrium_andersonii.AAC.1
MSSASWVESASRPLRGGVELASSSDQFSHGSLHKLPQALTALRRRLGPGVLLGECLLLEDAVIDANTSK